MSPKCPITMKDTIPMSEQYDQLNEIADQLSQTKLNEQPGSSYTSQREHNAEHPPTLKGSDNQTAPTTVPEPTDHVNAQCASEQVSPASLDAELAKHLTKAHHITTPRALNLLKKGFQDALPYITSPHDFANAPLPPETSELEVLSMWMADVVCKLWDEGKVPVFSPTSHPCYPHWVRREGGHMAVDVIERVKEDPEE